MQCPKCQAENPVGAYFCGTCGVQLRSTFEGEGPVDLHAAPELPPVVTESSNPFGEAEPHAREAYRSALDPPAADERAARWDPDAPGAGLAPPLAAPASLHVPPVAATPPPPPAGQHFPPPPAGYAGYGYSQQLPPGANTSGMGDGYPAPAEASGWTFAGFVPWGLFSFVNGNTTWGVIGLVLWLLGPYLVYSIYAGVTGKESAWRNRRFDSLQQYADTMRAWNTWGLVLMLLGFLGVFLYFIFIFAIIGAGVASEMN